MSYIDKITDKDSGESRIISPAAEAVRVENENYEGSDLDEVLDEIAEAIEDAGSGGYAPPPGGIPATDLAPAVQTSLGKADSAYQKPASGIPASDIAAGVIPDVSGLATKTEVNTGLADKVDKETGKGLSSNDYTTAEKNKLQNLPSNPVQSVTINGTNYTPTNGNVNLGNVQGERGPQGPTGNVQVDGNGNVLIVNNLEDGGTGAALSAEMGKRLALKAGTYAGAWARSKAVIVPFCWLWQETVGGAAICKPIWHIGNSVFIDSAGGVVSVQAAAIPATPTFSETSGSTVGKGTELTITPYADSALYYKIDNGNWIVSDVAVTVTITATCTITAKCVNNAGSSSEVQCTLTVIGPQMPQFAAADGTTIGTGNVVSRGGSIVVSVPEGGELHYSTDGENYTTASGLSVTIPVPAAGVHIWAYNIEDGEQSATMDITYTMAALAAPTFSKADGSTLSEDGETITLSGPNGATIYYTDNGDTPTSSSTLYQSGIVVTSSKVIKAIAIDNYGSSDVATASYTVPVVPKFKFKIRLTGDNSTEYVPTVLQIVTVDGVSTRNYNMTVDWGDGTSNTYTSYIQNKGCSHAYTGNQGDEFIITLKPNNGNLVIPSLAFGGMPNTNASSLYNPESLVAIIENTLTCETFITLGGTNVESVCVDAMQNNIGNWTRLPVMRSYPTGLLSHLTKTGRYLTNANSMLRGMPSTCVLTPENMNELASSITHVTNFGGMFNNFAGVCDIPDTFFDGVADASVTNFSQMVDSSDGGTSCTVTGDSTVLNAVINQKKTSDAQTGSALRGLKPRS